MVVSESLNGEVQLVIFTAGSEEYGLRIDQVQEIIRLLPITRVPRSPEYIEGVINLRGNVIPVINLHRRLALGPRTDSAKSRIMITHEEDIVMGIIVDSVKEVLILPERNIEPPAETGMTDVDHLQGIGKNSGRIILLLDLHHVLGVD